MSTLDLANITLIVSLALSTPIQSFIITGSISAPIILPTYLDYVKSSYASEARTVMSNINNASKMYYQTRGEWPSEIDELERAGQLDVSRSTKLKWSFDLQLSDQGGRITATSTEEMSGGAGHQVVYDADLGKFTGYGSPEGE
tara:strand:+ start:69 stop:497 length:429 start_codon:yes stop_codon:yes gene_type:complete